MKILFDQGGPVPLRRHLLGHTITTAYEQGWSSLTNGNLLKAAEQAGYQLLLTTDQNLRYQQKLADRQLQSLSYVPLHGRAFNYGLMRFAMQLKP